MSSTSTNANRKKIRRTVKIGGRGSRTSRMAWAAGSGATWAEGGRSICRSATTVSKPARSGTRCLVIVGAPPPARASPTMSTTTTVMLSFLPFARDHERQPAQRRAQAAERGLGFGARHDGGVHCVNRLEEILRRHDRPLSFEHLDRDVGRDLAAGVAAHAVGDREQTQTRD